MSGKREDPIAFDEDDDDKGGREEEEESVPSSDPEEREEEERKKKKKRSLPTAPPFVKEEEEEDDDKTVLEEDKEDKEGDGERKKKKQKAAAPEMPAVYRLHTAWSPDEHIPDRDNKAVETLYESDLSWVMRPGKDGILIDTVTDWERYHTGLDVRCHHSLASVPCHRASHDILFP